MLDAAMTLADGRLLAYTDCGDPSGAVVIYFHGAPSSRLDVVGLEDGFRASGVRVVSPDRPGYGGSSPRRGRSLDDWPGDVAALADHLGIERFAVLGLSSGGPYAVVCSALSPTRVVGAGVVAGVTDMRWPEAWRGYEESEATIMRIGDERAATVWCEAHYGPDGSKFFEDVGEMAPADLALLEEEAMAQGLLASVGEAFRQGVRGFAQDITVQGRPWPFDPGTIRVPTTVLHGDADTIVPLAHGRHTAELIPGAILRVRPGHGHLSIIKEIPKLAADLAAPLR